MITYRTGNVADLDAFIDLYLASTLGDRRPIDDRERMAAMLKNANLVITAWDGSLLVGNFACVVGFLLHHLPVRFGGSRFTPTKRHRQGIDSPHPIRRRA